VITISAFKWVPDVAKGQVRDLRVRSVTIDDVTEGHPEMVDQGQFEHELPFPEPRGSR